MSTPKIKSNNFKIKPFYPSTKVSSLYSKQSNNCLLRKHQPQKNTITIQTDASNLMPMFNKTQIFQQISLSQNDHNFKQESEDEKKGDRELIKNLDVSYEEDIKPSDVEVFQKGSVKKFYQSYKNLDKIIEANEFNKKKPNPAVIMLKAQEDLKLFPHKLGIIKENQDIRNLKLNRYLIGDKYGKVLGQTASYLPTIQNFYLNENRISIRSSSDLLIKIGKNARHIDLMKNEIGQTGVQSLVTSLQLRDCKIEYLNLEENKIGDKGIELLCNEILQNKGLIVLNLSKNLISNSSCNSFSNLLLMNDSLQELYLNWNQIKGQGGVLIFNALVKNNSLKVFDISFNSVGIPSGQCQPSVVKFFTSNKSIVHFDLSMNSFSLEDTIKIADASNQNQTIFGLHFTSNLAYVDSKGFIVINQTENQNPYHHRIDGVKINKPQRKFTDRSDISKDVCWICEGWHPFVFEYIPGVSGDIDSEPIYIHFNFEAFQPYFMGKMKQQNGVSKFVYKRMMPTGMNQFFFTASYQQTAIENYQSKPLTNPVFRSIKIEDKIQDCIVQNINFIYFKSPFEVVDGDYYPSQVDVLPRVKDEVYIPPKSKKKKRIWTFPVSIWAKDYKFENAELLQKCFERDWQCSRIHKFIKNQDDVANVKTFLSSVYKQLKETYKVYASINPCSDIWGISTNPMTEFCNSSNIIDNKTIKFSDVDLKFISTNSASALDWKGNPKNPDRYIVRYQFMEFLVRISEDKYIKWGTATNFTDSVKMLYECIKNEVEKYDNHRWRSERYFCEECDEVCKKFKPMFDHLYNKFSKKKVLPGQKRFMCLDELFEICQISSLLGENMIERDINTAFNLSIMTQVDELDSDKIFQLFPIEFMEAIARIADKVSLPPLGADPTQWNLEKRIGQSLHYKLESACVQILKTVCDIDFRNSFQIPTVSMFDKNQDDSD